MNCQLKLILLASVALPFCVACSETSDTRLKADESGSMISFPNTPSDSQTIRLFSDQDVLQIEILSDFPYRTSRNLTEHLKHPGTLKYDWQGQTRDFKVKLEARGSGRLSHCDFAPFKLHLKDDQSGTVFEGSHDSLKVVTHCDEGGLTGTELNGEDTIMVELLLYRMLEAYGVYSFKTRPVKVAYKMADGTPITDKLAFFVENKRNVVSRFPDLKTFAPDDYSDQLSAEIQSQGLNEQQTVAFVEKKLDVYNFLSTFLAQVMILNDDWSGTITGANMETFITNNEKVVRAHYDLDLSVLTGKFSSDNELSFEGFKYALPASIASDVSLINAVCTSNEFPFKAVDKTAACKDLIPKIASRKDKIAEVVRAFTLIPNNKKDQILARVDMFFDALNQVASSL